jgi:hypothetical protein
MSVALATRGMIQSCCQRDQVISFDKPGMQAVLEVRPRIRMATSPATPSLTPPVTTVAVELKPVVTGATAPTPPSPDSRPKETTALELRPVIKKAEKE